MLERQRVASLRRQGRLVAVDPAIPCERCDMCFQGHRNLSPTVRFSGHGQDDGPFREVMAWPTHLVHPLPESFSGADGAMLDVLGVALHAWDFGHARTASTVAVVGVARSGCCWSRSRWPPAPTG